MNKNIMDQIVLNNLLTNDDVNCIRTALRWVLNDVALADNLVRGWVEEEKLPKEVEKIILDAFQVNSIPNLKKALNTKKSGNLSSAAYRGGSLELVPTTVLNKLASDIVSYVDKNKDSAEVKFRTLTNDEANVIKNVNSLLCVYKDFIDRNLETLEDKYKDGAKMNPADSNRIVVNKALINEVTNLYKRLSVVESTSLVSKKFANAVFKSKKEQDSLITTVEKNLEIVDAGLNVGTGVDLVALAAAIHDLPTLVGTLHVSAATTETIKEKQDEVVNGTQSSNSKLVNDFAARNKEAIEQTPDGIVVDSSAVIGLGNLVSVDDVIASALGAVKQQLNVQLNGVKIYQPEVNEDADKVVVKNNIATAEPTVTK